MRIEEGFQQTPVSDEEPYATDPVLPALLNRLFPKRFVRSVSHNGLMLDRAAIRPIGELAALPSLTQYDQWGRRVDILRTSEGWRRLKAICQEEGIVAIPYERKHGEYSRINAFAKLLLMAGDNQVIYCPLGMSDGCARVIELYGTKDMKANVYPRLVSRDPAIAFTAGQWMTERPGGSDVSQTETKAKSSRSSAHSLGETYTLDGFKWFSSATDCDVSVALARTGTQEQGSRGLSLFLVPLRLPLFHGPASPISNNIYVHRLKDKLGTRAVPTAELSLEGAEAYLIGIPGAGVKHIVPVLGITCIHSAVSSIGALRRGLAIARSYASVRRIEGGRRYLSESPLHVAELAKISLTYRALAHMTFGVAHLLGKSECGTATADDELRLRLLTPVVKGFSAEKAVVALEECMASLGGQGYMEENVIPRLIRDTLVEKIWEGTITVMALDVRRSAQNVGAVDAYMKWARALLSSVPETLRKDIKAPLSNLLAAIEELPSAYKNPAPDLVPRPAFYLLSQVTVSLYLLEHAIWSHTNATTQSAIDTEAFSRWVEDFGLAVSREEVRKALKAGLNRSKIDTGLVYGGYDRAKPKL
ncbi:acyl-CoA dehydrogenase/oxidase [Lactarius quietus]|nr:acyl-CoA dehydrogenase/oxidase [Lactarius quietus]